MNILLIGSGGREHALAWKLAQNPKVEKIYCAPGNGGTALESKCENINIKDIEGLIDFAKAKEIELTIVGPEEPLINGIVNRFNEEELKIFGPERKAALLEGSKIYSKDFMKNHGIKTATYEKFSNPERAIEYAENCKFPLVIKAEGLAGGKGVVICKDLKEAKDTVKSFMVEDIFQGAGKNIVIEEFLQGVEASILAITDGETMIPFISAKDHKQILDGDKGPNTGGMGAIAPNPYVDEVVMEDFNNNILLPTLEGIKKEKMNYKGIVFFGVMITQKGCYLLEYNVRMGDPETQVVLSLMESDLLDLIERTIEGKLKETKIQWKESHGCCLVLASSGYPGSYKKGFEIKLEKNIKGKIFLAGTESKGKKLITSGGRVMSLVTLGRNLEEARKLCYEDVKTISFENIYYRRDIGRIKS